MNLQDILLVMAMSSIPVGLGSLMFFDFMATAIKENRQKNELVVYCKYCKFAHADYWYSHEHSGFSHFECYHPKVKKYINRVDYSTGEDNSYISAPRGDVRNKNGNCKDFELYITWYKFWIHN